ncbi:ABC transporter ATP-binding protein [Halorussus marinus]|uniref:ABC transporter ATP-binding protein n=1 Tax=Halorussus marinus TaxID=2505976 RepID=UPI00106E03AA|nr:ABC transporter ATP-binding protein [Halorussus marinus]
MAERSTPERGDQPRENEKYGTADSEEGNRDLDGSERDARADRGPVSEFAADDLVVGYPGIDEPVIEGETLRVPPGKVTALIGPNGSGKSTFLKGCARQLTPESGAVLLDGRTVESFGPKEFARRLGLLSQENTSPASISVDDLVERGRYPHNGFLESPGKHDENAVDEAISLAGIEHLRDREVGSLSGGQKQLVWIAMALAQDTDVLLLDEPTTFLDPHHQLEVMQIVERLRDESRTTVVLVLHDIAQAARYGDYVVALKDGTIRASGPPETVVTRELLADVFEIDAEVIDTEHGPVVVPLDPIGEDHPNRTSASESIPRGDTEGTDSE